MFYPLVKDDVALAKYQTIDTKEELLAKAIEKGFDVDATFDKFLGYSDKSVCLDEEGLWDINTDTKQSAIINLYGVWVSE